MEVEVPAIPEIPDERLEQRGVDILDVLGSREPAPSVVGVMASPTEIRLPVLGSCLRMNLAKRFRSSSAVLVPPNCLNRAGTRDWT